MSIVRWRSMLRFLRASRGAYFAGTLIAVIVLTVVLAAAGGITAAGQLWGKYLDPLASFSILVIALAVWFKKERG